MQHFKIGIAGLTVEIAARYPMIEKICADYRTDDSAFADFSVYVTPEQLRAKIASFSVPLPEGMAECVCVSDAIALRLLRFDAFLLHAAIIEWNGKTFGIVAPRGVGKTTHAHLWQARYGDKVRVINGDKPIVRRMADGRFYAFGTPFCGKEGEQINIGKPLDALILLRRGERDRTLPPDDQTYLNALIHQVVFPEDDRSMARGAKLLARFMRETPAVILECTPTDRAVDAAEAALRGLLSH